MPSLHGKPGHPQRLPYWQVRDLFRLYGLKPSKYMAMLRSQGWACKVCRVDTPRTSHVGRHHTMFAVDHDHKTGEVRGLLCNKCNMNLGVYENVKSDERFLQYLNECASLERSGI